ncbi:MAG: carboxylating nicotinate-nucleotide diphosphorylase [Rhodospirillaceae bacterium]
MTAPVRPLPLTLLDPIIQVALAEDIGTAGDVTSGLTVHPGTQASAEIAARKSGVVAGVAIAARVFAAVDPAVTTQICIEDGQSVKPGSVVLRVSGLAQSLLTAERTALNFLGHLSGVATETRKLVDAVAHTQARICCTRKTTPGLRALEKYAVRCGGGYNHRFGLGDGLLIKDNHVVAAQGVAAAVRHAKSKVGHMVKVEVEVDRLDQIEAALEAGADVIMLDNMDPATMAQAVKQINGKAIVEASGSITLDTVAAVAESGVDVISVGWITHSAPCLDVGLDFKS